MQANLAGKSVFSSLVHKPLTAGGLKRQLSAMGSLRQVEKVVRGQKKMEGEPLALLLLMCLAMEP